MNDNIDTKRAVMGIIIMILIAVILIASNEIIRSGRKVATVEGDLATSPVVSPEQATDDTADKIITVSFSNGTTTIPVTFNNNDMTVTFSHPQLGADAITLESAISASGARYANTDESIVFWEHQSEGTIFVNDEEIFRGALANENSTEETVTDSNLTANTWTWKNTTDATGTVTTPKDVTAFTITFNADGKVNGTTDCNGFSGSYTLGETSSLTFSPLASTMMYCEGSEETVFTKLVSDVKSYSLSGDTLTLTTEDGSKVLFQKTTTKETTTSTEPMPAE